MITQQELLAMLADGELHSGRELADQLGVTRSAVWKQIGALENLGLDVEARAGQGYRLRQPLELLDAAKIRGLLRSETRAVLGVPAVVWSSASTNSELSNRPPPVAGRAVALVAEHQSAGRGRRGREWLAPLGGSICLSVAWQYLQSPENLACLSLAIGVGAVRALRRSGVAAAELKWPNDIVAGDAKLAGILVDVRGEAGGPLHVVAGIGVNVRMNDTARAAVVEQGGLAPVALSDFAGTAARNATVAYLLDELCAVFRQFGAEGFAPFLPEWVGQDYLLGKTVRIKSAAHEATGEALGITPDGQLRVRIAGKEQRFATGDVSVRPDL